MPINFELVKRLVPDEIATEEDKADIAAARERYAKGDVIDMGNLETFSLDSLDTMDLEWK